MQNQMILVKSVGDICYLIIVIRRAKIVCHVVVCNGDKIALINKILILSIFIPTLMLLVDGSQTGLVELSLCLCKGYVHSLIG